MGRLTQSTLLIAELTLLVGISSGTLAEAAAPRIIMFYGGNLPKPVVLHEWRENMEFMRAISHEAKVTAKYLEVRPYIIVALFWGQEWVRYGKDGDRLNRLRPEQANQHGRFYPAVANKRAIFVFNSVPGPWPLTREVEKEGTEILAKHGIPIRLRSASFHYRKNGRCCRERLEVGGLGGVRADSGDLGDYVPGAIPISVETSR
jgi:hypothetical protein